MKCYICKKECSLNNGDISLYDEQIGGYTVKNVEYYKCESCKESLFPAKTLKKIDDCRELALKDLISSLPISEFIEQADACKILNVSRQAFHKNKRIKSGFIYNIKIGKSRFFLKKSLELFKKTGDGRFKLSDTPSEYLIEAARDIISTSDITYSEKESFDVSSIDKIDFIKSGGYNNDYYNEKRNHRKQPTNDMFYRWPETIEA